MGGIQEVTLSIQIRDKFTVDALLPLIIQSHSHYLPQLHDNILWR